MEIPENLIPSATMKRDDGTEVCYFIDCATGSIVRALKVNGVYTEIETLPVPTME